MQPFFDETPHATPPAAGKIYWTLSSKITIYDLHYMPLILQMNSYQFTLKYIHCISDNTIRYKHKYLTGLTLKSVHIDTRKWRAVCFTLYMKTSRLIYSVFSLNFQLKKPHGLNQKPPHSFHIQ